MPKYERHTMNEAARLALKNATQYMREAQLLSDMGNHGRGLALLILGREEAQKSVLLAYCAAGMYDSSDARVGQEIKKALDDHEYKHDSAWMVNVLSVYAINEAFPKAQATREAIDNLKKLASPKGGMLEDMKHRGLYVGIDREGRILHPGDITKKEFEDFRGVALVHLSLASGIQGIVLSDNTEQIALLRVQARYFRLLEKEKPLTFKKIEELEQLGKLDNFMADSGRFLLDHSLAL